MMSDMGYDEAEIDHANKRLKAQEMRVRFADGQVSEQAAVEAADEAREACLHFKFLCRTRRDSLLRTLDDPARVLTPADREARQRQYDELTKQLTELEADCPGEREQRPPPTPTAKRTMC